MANFKDCEIPEQKSLTHFVLEMGQAIEYQTNLIKYLGRKSDPRTAAKTREWHPANSGLCD